jgi:hypothetical protein
MIAGKLLLHPLAGMGLVLGALQLQLLPQELDPLVPLVMMTVWATPTAVLVHSLATMLQVCTVWLAQIVKISGVSLVQCVWLSGAACDDNGVGDTHCWGGAPSGHYAAGSACECSVCVNDPVPCVVWAFMFGACWILGVVQSFCFWLSAPNESQSALRVWL